MVSLFGFFIGVIFNNLEVVIGIMVSHHEHGEETRRIDRSSSLGSGILHGIEVGGPSWMVEKSILVDQVLIEIVILDRHVGMDLVLEEDIESTDEVI